MRSKTLASYSDQLLLRQYCSCQLLLQQFPNSNNTTTSETCKNKFNNILQREKDAKKNNNLLQEKQEAEKILKSVNSTSPPEKEINSTSYSTSSTVGPIIRTRPDNSGRANDLFTTSSTAIHSNNININKNNIATTRDNINNINSSSLIINNNNEKNDLNFTKNFIKAARQTGTISGFEEDPIEKKKFEELTYESAI